MLDFSELGGNGRGLEQLVREILLAMDFRPSWSGVGPDDGRDLLFEERGLPVLGGKIRRWLVSCKDNSISGAAVGVGELGSVVDLVKQHGAEAFLLVCTTHPSSGAVERLRAIEARADGSIPSHIWDGPTLERLLLQPRMWSLAQQFMPVSADAQGWKIFGTAEPNRWVAVHRGHYFHLSKRVGGGPDFDLASLDERLDDLSYLEKETGWRLRLRGIWLDDAKGGGYDWYVDCLLPSGSVLPNATAVEARLRSGWAHNDGQFHHFIVEVRTLDFGSDHFDVDHYEFYSRLPPFV
jgi:hypothetical protein